MANRKNTFLLKRSNVAGKVPAAGDLQLGELAINTADAILYASGTTTNSILPIGWDRVARTGDTMTGTLYVPTVSATTISATVISLNTNYSGTTAVGSMTWNPDFGAPQVGLIGGNVVQKIGETIFSYVRNNEATTLNKGEVVYIFGAQGDKVSVKRASNLSELTSSKTLGVVSESIVSGQIGYVTTQGVISGLDLQSYNTGDLVWLGSDSGTYTSVKAQAPNHLVFVGVVLRNNQGNGQLFVRSQNGYELKEIHDVYIPVTPSDGQTIAWNTTNTRWELSSQSLSKVLLVGNTASTSINMSGNDLTNIDEISTNSTNMKLQDILNSTLIFYSNNC